MLAPSKYWYLLSWYPIKSRFTAVIQKVHASKGNAQWATIYDTMLYPEKAWE